MRWLIYFLLALSPLPLASARPAWQWFWVCVVGVSFIVYQVVQRKRSFAPPPMATSASLVMALVFVLWGLFQAWVPIGANHELGLAPVDDRLVELGTISVSPQRTVSVSMFFLSHILFAFVAFMFVERRDRGVKLVRFCGVVGLVYAAYGFAVFVSGNETILWYEKWANFQSLTSTFVNRNNYAAYAGLGLQCLVAYAIFWTQDELAENRTGRELYRHLLETMLQKAWWLPIGILVTATGVLLTNSRAGFVSVIAATFLLVLLSPNSYQRTGGWLKRLMGYAGVLSVSAGLFYWSGEALEGRLQTDASKDLRFVNYPYILEAIEDRPLLGFGLGNFEQVHGSYRPESDHTVWIARAHSDYLELAHTAGIPATLWFLIAISIAVVYLLRRLKWGRQYRAFIALGISATVQMAMHAVVDFPLTIPAVSYLWVAILATSLGIAHKCELAHKRDNR